MSSPQPIEPRDAGFALVLVLWIAALLALAATALSVTARSHVGIIHNGIEADRAELLADAGLLIVMRELAITSETAGKVPPVRRDTPEGRFVSGGPAVTCRLPDGEHLRLSLTDEAGKVNLNQASPDLLRGLLAGLGLPDEAARSSADAIADFRDADDTRRPAGAEADDYRAAGRTQGPKNAAFDSIEEVSFVLGIGHDLAARVIPFLTIHSGSGGVDLRHAPAGLADILARGAEASGAPTSLAARAFGTATDALPPGWSGIATDLAHTIRAEVTTLSGQRLAREALVIVQRGAARASDLERAQRDPSITRLRQLPGRAGRTADAGSIVLRPVRWARVGVSPEPPGATGVPLSPDEVLALPAC